MMMRFGVMLGVVTALVGGQAATPVAKDFPNWTGVGGKPPICGRELTPSDLRHKATVIVEFEANEKLKDQLKLAVPLLAKTGLSGLMNANDWETRQVPRNVVVVFSNRSGGKGRGAVEEILAYNGKDATALAARRLLQGFACSVYDNVTFDGAPDGTGKRPFVFVMGPKGKEPLYQGKLTADSVKAIGAAIDKAASSVGGWKPYYGSLSDSKYHPMIEKALKEGKPLATVEKAALKDVTLKDADKAREAQIIYDALCQTRNDLVLKIMCESLKSRHCAAYDIERLKAQWPQEMKRIKEAAGKIQAIPEVADMAKMYCKLMAWSEPDFTCKSAGEAKKIVTELNMMKKKIGKFKDSTVTEIQTIRLLLESKIEDLISVIETKAPAK